MTKAIMTTSKMIFTWCIFTLIAAIVFISDNGNTALAQASVSSSDEANEAAKKYWDNFVCNQDGCDLDAMDELIEKYPNTEMATFALAARYTLLAQNPNIEDYNKFVKEHGQTLEGQKALHELFAMYRAQDRANMYREFMNRYPNTEQAQVACLRLQTLMFEYARLLDEVDGYDEFMEFFPDSTFVELASELAYKRNLEEIGKMRQEIEDDDSLSRSDKREEITDLSNRLLADYTKERGDLMNLRSEIDPASNELSPAHYKVIAITAQVDRMGRILLDVFPDKSTVITEIGANWRHDELIKEIRRIQKIMIQNHRELIAELRESTRKICTELREGFQLLHQDNQAILSKLDSGFKQIEMGFNRLHDDLDTIHSDLKDIKEQMKSIDQSIQQTNARLDKLDQRLDQIYVGITSVEQTIGEGFSKLGEQVQHLEQSMNENFRYTQELQLESLKVQQVSLEKLIHIESNQQTQIQLAEETLQATNQVAKNTFATINAINAMNENMTYQFTAVNSNISGMRNDMNRGFNSVNSNITAMHDDMNRGFTSTNQNISGMRREMNSGFNKVNRNLGKLYNVTNAMRNDLRSYSNNLTQQIQVSQSRSSGSSGFSLKSIWKKVKAPLAKIVGKGVGAVASCIPYAGPFIGPALGNTTEAALAGKNRKEIGRSAVEGLAFGAIDKFTGGTTSKILKGVVKTGVSKDSLSDAGRQLIADRFGQNADKVEKLLDVVIAQDTDQRKASLLSIASSYAGEKGLSLEQLNVITRIKNRNDLSEAITFLGQNKNIGINSSALKFAVDRIY